MISNLDSVQGKFLTKVKVGWRTLGRDSSSWGELYMQVAVSPLKNNSVFELESRKKHFGSLEKVLKLPGRLSSVPRFVHPLEDPASALMNSTMWWVSSPG